MAVIKDYMDGPCRIVVHDDFICAPEEVQGIVDRVSRIALSEELRRSVLARKKEDSTNGRTGQEGGFSERVQGDDLP